MSNSFGSIFRITTYGESHGKAIGVVIDGCPAGLAISREEIQQDLDRRRPGQSELTTPRQEKDQVEILAGIFQNLTLGTPISLMIANEDQHSQDYDELKELYRPGHADLTYEARYGFFDWRGGGRSSNRESAARVAAAAIAKKLNRQLVGLDVLAWVDQVRDIKAEVDPETVSLEAIEQTPTRCPDLKAAEKIHQAILKAKQEGDSLGGVVRFRIKNVPAGLGSPVFGKLSSDLAQALMSINATKSFELGAGSSASLYKGSEHNDPIVLKQGKIGTSSNKAGGLLGGISNGETIYGALYFKPTSTIKHQQTTLSKDHKPIQFSAKGRHDPCVLPRATPIVEAMLQLVLVNHLLAFPHSTVARLQKVFG